MPRVLDRQTKEKTLLVVASFSECKAGVYELTVAALLDHSVGYSLGNSSTLIIQG